MSIDPKAVTGYLGAHPTAAGLGLVVALVVLVIAWRAGRGITRAVQRSLRGKHPEDILTFVVAGLITAISAQGMFRFFGDKLSMPWWMQSLTFCVFELAQVTCALRARRKIRDPKIGSAGIDGALVWVMAAISAILSATDASGWGAPARMIFPFAAAVMWELGLAIERRRIGRGTIHWRINFERIAVRLGIAEATGRTAGEVDTHRRVTRVALAAHRLRTLQASGAADRRLRRAERRLNAATRAAVEYAGLATSKVRQDELMAQLAVLNAATSLAEVSPPAPWDRPDPVVAVFDDARLRFAPLISGAVDTGTEHAAELDSGTGTDTGSETPAGTGTEEPSDTGSDTGTEDGTDTGSEGDPDTGTETPKKTGTRRRRRTGPRTAAKARAKTDRATLLDRARDLNDEHFRKHGKPISGDKLAGALRVSKGTALELLREVKRPRRVRSEDGAA